jgi:hypothetical protein
MRRAWPVLVLALLILVALWVRPPGTSRPSSRPPASPAASADLERTAEASSFARVERALDAPLPDRPDFAAEEEDAGPFPANLRWLLAFQNEDGTWGEGPTSLEGVPLGKTGMTGLVLLSFLGAGFSHLSKDRYDGLCVGEAVKKALVHLLKDQREDGTFRSARSGLDQAIATLALNEAYGLTGSKLFKDQAQAAIRALGGLQLQDGSWGDAQTTFWAADALKSAEISDLAVPADAYAGLKAYYDRRGSPDVREAVARMQIDRNRLHPAASAGARLDPPTMGRSLPELYVQTRAVFQFDGPSGPAWKAWNEPFKASILRRSAPAGVNERVLHESLSALNLEILYRYSHVYGAR